MHVTMNDLFNLNWNKVTSACLLPRIKIEPRHIPIRAVKFNTECLKSFTFCRVKYTAQLHSFSSHTLGCYAIGCERLLLFVRRILFAIYLFICRHFSVGTSHIMMIINKWQRTRVHHFYLLNKMACADLCVASVRFIALNLDRSSLRRIECLRI